MYIVNGRKPALLKILYRYDKIQYDCQWWSYWIFDNCISQAKFAKSLSMSNGYIAGIELGHNNVNDRIVKLICFTYHVSEHWLKTGEGEMFDEKPDQLAELASSIF